MKRLILSSVIIGLISLNLNADIVCYIFNGNMTCVDDPDAVCGENTDGWNPPVVECIPTSIGLVNLYGDLHLEINANNGDIKFINVNTQYEQLIFSLTSINTNIATLEQNSR